MRDPGAKRGTARSGRVAALPARPRGHQPPLAGQPAAAVAAAAGARTRSSSRELAEAREQLAATSEILHVIARSPGDVQPVFDTIVTRAARLCEANFAFVVLDDGGRLLLAARTDCTPEFAAFLQQGKLASRASATGRAALERRPVQILDFLAEPDVVVTPAHRAEGVRTVLAVPLLRDERLLGVISIWRREVRAFSERQIELLRTFADQAVIAIENTRNFVELRARNRELSEALEQQTATSEILRVISCSRTDTQPVFETIVEAAMSLCRATSANVFTFDGVLLHLVAIRVVSPEVEPMLRRIFPRPPDRCSAASWAVMARQVVTVPDVLLDPEYIFRAGAKLGFRSVLGVPLMRDATPIGAIAIGRSQPGPFPDKQIALLKTFADQAVIAIENVRLFRELEARTAELTRSVQQLQALAEVGQAVSSTLDLATVLRTIASRAIELSGMDGGAIFEYDEGRAEFRLHATDGLPDELVAALRSTPIPKGEGAIGRLATNGEPVAVPDIRDAALYRSPVRRVLTRLGYRSLLAVPLLREDRLLGGLVVNRRRPGDFEPRVIELLKTFATQSALAIQNARLFKELEDKGRQLEIASRHKSAFLANMSHELRTPLNAIIGFTRIVLRHAHEQLEPKQVENLDKILASGQHLLSLINSILDLAKVEAGHVELRPAEVQPARVLEQCLRTIEPLVKDGVSLQRDFDGELAPMSVDEERLRQIVINLLSNAAKFTAQGAIGLPARAHDGRLAVTVCDTGIGIAADKLDLIFEEFEQTDASSTRVHGGTGLGLAIARRLARLMGGDIGVASVPAAGSTFTLTLPIGHPAPPQ